jgi:hypothetical protein
MKKHKTTTAVAALAFALVAAPALAAGTDGSLPLYPNGKPAHGMESIPANALSQGVPYQQTTSDSVQAVDAWYRSNAPKGCSRMAASGAVRYSCPGGYIVIQNHDGTIISFVPPFGH